MGLFLDLKNRLRGFRIRHLPLGKADADWWLRRSSRQLAQLAEAGAGDTAFQLWSATGRYADTRSLTRFETRVYSQNGEDGMIAEIFRRIGARDRYFVEIGVEDGRENNSRLLLEQGWRGVWIEGDAQKAKRAREIFARFIESGHLRVAHAFVTAENASTLLAQEGAPETFDFLSLDVDRNTSHVWRALRQRARVSVIEYNASLPPSLPLEVPYDAQGVWDGGNWYGASLKALELIGRGKGAALVGCDLRGVNAFFVCESEAAGVFLTPFTAETHFEPSRAHYLPTPQTSPSSEIARDWVVTRGG